MIRSVGKASIVLKNTLIMMYRMVVKIQMVKPILMRSQMEMTNVLLDNGERAIPVIR